MGPLQQRRPDQGSQIHNDEGSEGLSSKKTVWASAADNIHPKTEDRACCRNHVGAEGGIVDSGLDA